MGDPLLLSVVIFSVDRIRYYKRKGSLDIDKDVETDALALK